MELDSISPTQDLPRKVLHIVGGLNRGGIETWLLQMVQNIDRSRYNIDVVVDSEESYDYRADFEAAGCRILPSFWPAKRLTYSSRLISLFRNFGPYDIVHSHVDNRSGLNCLLAQYSGVPVRIIHNHAPSELRVSSPIRTLFSQVAFFMARHSATHLMACSKKSMNAYLDSSKLVPKRQQVVYNSVELSKFNIVKDKSSLRQRLNLPVDTVLVSYVARFFPHKNHRQIFRIADQMNQNGKRVHFAFAGSYGPLLADIQAEAQKRSDITAFVGLQDVSDLLLASDIFIFPSLHEGFGIVAIEAAAAGLAIVATDLDAIREACPPLSRRLMFSPNNDSQAIASLELLMRDANLYADIRRDAIDWAKSFSIQASLRSLTSFYDEALDATNHIRS